MNNLQDEGNVSDHHRYTASADVVDSNCRLLIKNTTEQNNIESKVGLNSFFAKKPSIKLKIKHYNLFR